MNWYSWQEFWQMGGYAGYVWPAFAACFIAMVWEMASLRQRRKAARAKAVRGAPRQTRPVHLMTVQAESAIANDANDAKHPAPIQPAETQ